MHVSTLRRGGRNGTLAVVTPSGDRAWLEPGGIPTLQAALDDWTAAAPLLRECSAQLLADEHSGEKVYAEEFCSPLPAAYEWSEVSSYLPHMERIRAARGLGLPPEYLSEPIAYQAGSGRFRDPQEDIQLPDPDWCLDLEATVAVVTDDIAIGMDANEAAARILFVMITNDLTYRAVMGRELAKSIGPYQAKPARAFAPIAVTPDSLGTLWDGRMLHATMRCWVNGELLGSLSTDQDYAFDAGQVLAYLTRTRALRAGSVVGLGTVSNRNSAHGFGCLAEKRAVESSAGATAATRWLGYGDVVRIEAFDTEDNSIFGALNERVVKPDHPAPAATADSLDLDEKRG